MIKIHCQNLSTSRVTIAGELVLSQTTNVYFILYVTPFSHYCYIVTCLHVAVRFYTFGVLFKIFS